jgi:hypothetical protein
MADREIRRMVALRAIEGGLLRLQWLAAATRFEIALRRHDRALKHACKAGFNPDQPRVAAGNPDGGQWTTVSSGGGISIALPTSVVWAIEETGGADDSGDAGDFGQSLGIGDYSLDWTELAGDIPTGDPPEIPSEPPPTTRLRNIVVRALTRVLGRNIWLAVEAGSWIYDHKHEINSFLDSPKSLEELRAAANTPARGYDIHHIVERSSAAKDGSEADLIDAPENLVRIPRWRHWLVNGWYQTRNEDFDGQTPRQFLQGKSWDERRRVGLYALINFDVLKP